MHTRTPALALLLAACPLEVPETPATAETGATPETSDTTDAASGSVSAADLTTGDAPTTTDVTTDAPDLTTGDTSTGEAPKHMCPAILPAPVNCEPIPEVCGDATPIAGAADGYVSSPVLTAEHVWFRYTGPSEQCYSGFYRVAKRGGDAEFVRTVERLVDLEADDEAVYRIERTDDVTTHTITALIGDAELLLGQRLYFTWSDPTFDPEPESPLHRRLVSVMGDISVLLADDASDRQSLSVGVDAAHVYFATGDLTQDTPGPMGISKVLTTGGPATPLFPTSLLRIDQLLVDDTAVYFRDDPADLYAVSSSGGALRHVWHGELDDNNNALHLHQDDHDLYFGVEGPIHGDVPTPGENFIVRVAKDAEIP